MLDLHAPAVRRAVVPEQHQGRPRGGGPPGRSRISATGTGGRWSLAVPGLQHAHACRRAAEATCLLVWEGPESSLYTRPAAALVRPNVRAAPHHARPGVPSPLLARMPCRPLPALYPQWTHGQLLLRSQRAFLEMFRGWLRRSHPRKGMELRRTLW